MVSTRWSLVRILLSSVSKCVDNVPFRYYYNHNTKISTWIRPPALRHVVFANPKENEIIDRNDNFEASYDDEDETVGGWLDGVSDTVLSFIPGWGGQNQLVS